MIRSVLVVCLVSVLGVLAPVASAQPPHGDSSRHLVVRAGVISAFDEDLDATYGVVPVGELGVSWPIGAHTRLLFSTGFATRTGDPYRDVDGFESDPVSRLRVVPLTLGVRIALNEQGPVRGVLGLAVGTAWLEERIPAGAGLETRDGMGYGLFISLGPEWRSRDGRRAVSLDVALGGFAAEVERYPNRHDVDLRGVTVRIGYAFALGQQEVSR